MRKSYHCVGYKCFALCGFAVWFLAARGGFLSAQEAIVFTPPEWKYGVIGADEIVRTEVTARNRGDKAVKLSLVPTCTCLTVSPAERSLAPGQSAAFDLSFDPKDDEGKTNRFFIVKTDPPGPKPSFFILSGAVRAGDRPRGAQGNAGPGAGAAGGGWGSASTVAGGAEAKAAGGAVSSSALTGSAPSPRELVYYYMPGCRSCEKFLAVDLPELEARTGARVEVVRRDLLGDAAYEEYAAFASSVGQGVRAVPALRLGGVLLQGDEEIAARLPALLVAGGAAPASANSGDGRAAAAAAVAALPVILAGLVDGINPCAFTTLVFLLASLALAGRGRREVLAIGAFFSAGVFLAYLGAGFGLFAALRAAQAIALVSTIIRWALVAVLAVFAALSVYDYALIHAGRPSDMVLQLPDSFKLRIHESIRKRRRASALALSSFVLGVLVSIFEFACTGQVYLPTLAYLARAQGRTDAILLLVLYNLCFIVPLLVVFAASYCGVSSKRIAELFQKRMGAVKLLLAAVFVALAVLTVVT